jgi:3-methyladenine DNA glycosylase AlkD
MNKALVLKEIRNFFEKNSDEAIVKKYSWYFKEGYDAYGIDKETLKELTDLLIAKHFREWSLKDIFSLGNELMASGKYEEASLVIVFLTLYRNEHIKSTKRKKTDEKGAGDSIAAIDREVFERLKFWFDQDIRNWAHSDVICSELLSKFLTAGSIDLFAYESWKSSASKWTRRAVPVSMIALLKREDDYRFLLDFIDSLMLDSEKPVQQGLGWFLRETWKREPELVEDYLMKWRQTAPRVIFQYATEKMDKERRVRFRREKSK